MKAPNSNDTKNDGTAKVPFQEKGVYNPRWNSNLPLKPESAPVAAIPVYIVNPDEQGGETEQGY